MLVAREAKTRSSRKDKNCPPKTTPSSSSVPGNHPVEVEEMEAVNLGGASDAQQTDYLQVAWLLREKLNDLLNGDVFTGEQFPECEGLRSVLDLTVSRHVVSVDPEMLNPVLWKSLPRELLHLVLARLPVPAITRLRCLSRQWRGDMATVNSHINQACDEASPSMVALLSRCYKPYAFLVTIYDTNKRGWQQTYRLQLRRPIWKDNREGWPLYLWTPLACDGGLVCFLSLWGDAKRYWCRIVVVNLLTRVQHELPPLEHNHPMTIPAMVRIQVDSETKCYQVVASSLRGDSLAKVYDSRTRKWTCGTVPRGFVFGPIHKWSRSGVNIAWRHMLSAPPGAFDLENGKLQLCNMKSHPPESPRKDWAFIHSAIEKDRMFVLQEQRQMNAFLGEMVHRGRFRITEYHFEKETKDLVQGKSYECPSFQKLLVRNLSAICLSACDGFVMVTFHHGEFIQHFRLLDLSTGEWSSLPDYAILEESHTMGTVLCRAFWNAVP